MSSSETQRSAAGDAVLRRHGRLFSRTLLVSGFTLASRLLGLAREVLTAAIFGHKSAVLDAFVTAWRVPNLFRRFFGEGAISTALQTRLTEVDVEHGDAAGRALFLRTVSLVARILVVVCAVTMIVVHLTPDAMPGTGWRWLGADPAPVRELTVRLLPFVVMICLSALAGGALQVRGHYVSPALAPLCLNVLWIATLAVIGVQNGLFASGGEVPADLEGQLEMARWLAWGVLLAGTLQLGIQVPALVRFGFLGGERGGERGSPGTSAREVIRRSVPLALGAAVYQINVLIDGFMAEGLLPDGGPTVHYLANRVQQFPLALIAIAATSAVFPALKALGHADRTAELRALHDKTQLAVAFLALPATAGLFVLSDPIVSVLFEHGAWGPDGVSRLAAVLRMLAFALLPAGAVGLTSRAYYARGDFRTPVTVSVWMLVLNILLNVALVAGAEMDADGLALATAISSWANLVFLLPGLHGRLGLPACDLPWRRRLSTHLAAALATGAASYFAYAGLAPHLAKAVALGVAIAAGGIAHFGTAAILGVPEIQALRRRR